MLLRNQADGERMASSSLGLKDAGGSFPAVLPRGSELSVTLRKDAGLFTFQLLAGGHKANRAVQTELVVMDYKFPNDPSGILKGKRHLGPDALGFEHPCHRSILPLL